MVEFIYHHHLQIVMLCIVQSPVTCELFQMINYSFILSAPFQVRYSNNAHFSRSF